MFIWYDSLYNGTKSLFVYFQNSIREDKRIFLGAWLLGGNFFNGSESWRRGLCVIVCVCICRWDDCKALAIKRVSSRCLKNRITCYFLSVCLSGETLTGAIFLSCEKIRWFLPTLKWFRWSRFSREIVVTCPKYSSILAVKYFSVKYQNVYHKNS